MSKENQATVADFEEPEISSPVETMRHSCAHIMAHAIQRIWPKARFGIGPTVENGFYYDIDIEDKLTPEDLIKIEKTMQAIIKENEPFVRKEHTIDEALAIFKELGQTFKIEIIENLRDQLGATQVSTYQQGKFLDLCRGPHITAPAEIKAFKLLSAAGAYWRGSEKNPQLQRIYGTAFATKAELDEHIQMLEEAKKRDHRKLGKELDLFSFHAVAPASPFFHPKGTTVYNRLVDLMRYQYGPYGYQEVITPQIMDVNLWHTSGHYANYKENMYFTEIDEREFAVKPMNCPAHTLIYATQKRSYRDLPLRLADFGRLHRYEKSGVTAGLTRVRTFCQDDAHIFCSPDQIGNEIQGVMNFILKTYDLFGFTDTQIALSTRPAKSVSGDNWDKATTSLKQVLDASGRPYIVNEGDGAFYGPKIDFKVKDALKRHHQLGTIQLDFILPERFQLEYVGADNTVHRPVMVHRAILGSLERFMGILIEHVAGAFPFWLAPVQARIINITDNQLDYCKTIQMELLKRGFRVELDDRNEKMGLKTREAQMAKVPFALVAGDREKADQSFSVRRYGEKESTVMSFDAVLKMFEELQALPYKVATWG